MFWEGFFWLALIITAIITTYAYFKYWAESRILYLWAIFQLLLIIVYYFDNFSPAKGTIQLILLLTAILFLITAKNFKKRKELMRNKKRKRAIRTILMATILITIIITITAILSANKLEIEVKPPTISPEIRTTDNGITIIEMKEPIRILIKNKGIMPLMINNRPIIICAYTNETENNKTTNRTNRIDDNKNQKQMIPIPEYNNYQMLSTRINVDNKEYMGKPITINPHSEKEIKITINKEPVMNQNYNYLLIKIIKPGEKNQQYLDCEEIMNNYDQKIELNKKN